MSPGWQSEGGTAAGREALLEACISDLRLSRRVGPARYIALPGNDDEMGVALG